MKDDARPHDSHDSHDFHDSRGSGVSGGSKSFRTARVSHVSRDPNRHDHAGGVDPRSPVVHGLVRGMLPLFLLALLQDGPLHGQDMIHRISDVHEGWKPSPGSVYPILRRHEDEGLIEGEWQRTRGAPKRVYRLTRKGRSALPKRQARLVTELVAARAIIDAHLNVLADGRLRGLQQGGRRRRTQRSATPSTAMVQTGAGHDAE